MRREWSDDYGLYKRQQLPPPGRENIIVRTPNPLPTPTSIAGTRDAPETAKGGGRHAVQEQKAGQIHGRQTPQNLQAVGERGRGQGANKQGQGQEKEEVDDLRDFLIVTRRALLLVVGYIERRYGIAGRR